MLGKKNTKQKGKQRRGGRTKRGSVHGSVRCLKRETFLSTAAITLRKPSDGDERFRAAKKHKPSQKQSKISQAKPHPHPPLDIPMCPASLERPCFVLLISDGTLHTRSIPCLSMTVTCIYRGCNLVIPGVLCQSLFHS